MNQSLFSIEQEYKYLVEQLIDAEGELTPELAEALEMNQYNLETKSSNYAIVIRQMKYDLEIIDSEKKRLDALKKQREKVIEKLTSNIESAMELYQVSEIKTPLMKLSLRKSESVEIENEALLDAEYRVIKTTMQPDKAKIKDAIKSGKTIAGAVLKTNINLQIK